MNPRAEKVAAVSAEVVKKHGQGALQSVVYDGPGEAPQVVKTGSLSLDLALGVGGWARGTIVEVWGGSKEGKTALAFHALGGFQRAGVDGKGVAALIDVTHTADMAYARDLGVDVDRLLVSQPDAGSQALDIAETLARSGAVDLVVVDDLGALYAGYGLDRDEEPSGAAREVARGLRQLCAIAHRTSTTILFVTRTTYRNPFSQVPGLEAFSVGGNALKFYAHVRVRAEERDGGVNLDVGKNKLAPPFSRAHFRVGDRGICTLDELLEVSLVRGIVRRSGRLFEWDDKGTWQPLGNSEERAKETIMAEGLDLMLERWCREKGATAPGEGT